ncbi:glutamate 5-kinase [Streptomyces prunicolor]|uniref:glutamate 5-kinase n=1 Tax=Streptomyces prunicolor TaxID=67348 RepID=UPI00224DBBB2|nr:glutamate 5-kinase [Streptomyces prunicolor]MCX5239887.1 glutamate 5-kinase [Streptomyces prunicolor]
MSRTAVVKLGSSSVTGAAGPDPVLLASTLESVIGVRAAGWNVVLVSSGAVSSGRVQLSRVASDPVTSWRLAAAVGQPFLMSAYRTIGDLSGALICQVLVSESDLKSPEQMNLVADLVNECFEQGVVPIVNGNDVTDTGGSDNDAVAAGIAVACRASKLLLLTDVDGVYSGNPGESERIDELTLPSLGKVMIARQGTGRGGMRSKLRAAEVAAHNGVETHVASARDREVIRKCLAGDPVGTRISGFRRDARRANDRWISGVSTSQGRLIINLEAENSIRSGSSLFSSGVKRITGTFQAGDVVEITDPAGHLVARGIVRVSSTLLHLVRSMRADELARVLAEVLRQFYLVSSQRSENSASAADTPQASSRRPQLQRALDTLEGLSYLKKRELATQVMRLFPAALTRLIFEADDEKSRFEDLQKVFEKISSDLSLIERNKLVVF